MSTQKEKVILYPKDYPFCLCLRWTKQNKKKKAFRKYLDIASKLASQSSSLFLQNKKLVLDVWELQINVRKSGLLEVTHIF